MTPTHQMRAAFLADIIAGPADDAPRLIYADWLEDQGEAERAEFIRVQIKLARLADASGHPGTTPLAWSCKCEVCEEAEPLRGRERELLWPVRRFVMPGVPDDMVISINGFVESDGCVCDCRRGFVESVRCALAAWLQHGPAVVRAHPVTRVELTDAGARPMVRYDDGSLYECLTPGTANAFGWTGTDLPSGITRLLAGPRGTVKIYGDESQAADARSAALVGWAKLPADRRGA